MSTKTKATQNLRTYETICITKVDMPDDKYGALLDRCKNNVTNEGKGEWLYTDEWGKAKIAYPIGKDNRGRWTYFRYRSTAAGIDEVKRTLKINEFVLREQTVRAAEDAKDYEPIRQSMVQDLQDRERSRDWRDDRRDRRPGGGRGRYEGGQGRDDRDSSGGDDDGDMNFDEA